jgi:hypothetical protein
MDAGSKLDEATAQYPGAFLARQCGGRRQRREGVLVGYGLQASKVGVADRIDGDLVRTPRAKFHLSIALPPSMRLGGRTGMG